LEIHDHHLFQICAGLGSDSLFSVAFANGRLHLLGGDVLGSVNGSGFRAMSTQDMFICSHWSRGRYFDRLSKWRTNSYRQKSPYFEPMLLPVYAFLHLSESFTCSGTSLVIDRVWRA
jgi:hypothetical protein